MSLTNKQKAAMAAIVLVGLLAGAAMLTGGLAAPVDHDEHGHAAASRDGHGDEHGHEHDGAVENAEPNTHADRVTLTAEQIRIAGITVEAADSARIRSSVEFPGEIRFNEDRTAHVVPRLAGVVESVPADLGQEVKKGDVLAIIASPALAEHRSELLAAEQRLRLASTTHEREKQLWQDKISAEQDYLQARASLQEARIAVQSAQQKLAAI